VLLTTGAILSSISENLSYKVKNRMEIGKQLGKQSGKLILISLITEKRANENCFPINNEY
jgi:hypothetical protein